MSFLTRRHELEDPMVLCYSDEITSLLTKWLQGLESLAAYLMANSSPGHTHFPSPSAQNGTAGVEVQHETAIPHQERLGGKRVSYERVSEAFHAGSYQSLSGATRRAASELATLCAEMEVYASESKEGSEREERGKGETSAPGGETRSEPTDVRYGLLHVH